MDFAIDSTGMFKFSLINYFLLFHSNSLTENSDKPLTNSRTTFRALNILTLLRALSSTGAILRVLDSGSGVWNR
jgi:hypothetical protein